MTSTLTVPPLVIPRVREGAHLQLAFAAHEIASSAQAFEKDDPPLHDRREMERVWALLDQIGWSGIAPEPVELGLREHSIALMAALDRITPYLQEWLDEMPDTDERKPDRTDELHAMEDFGRAARRAVERIELATPPGAVAIPPALLGRVREGAYGLLVVAGEAIVRSAYAHVQPEPMSRLHLERAWALLGMLGWHTSDHSGERIELGITEHGAVLHAAVETMLPLLNEWFDNLDPADPSRPDRADELRRLRQFAVQARRAATGE